MYRLADHIRNERISDLARIFRKITLVWIIPVFLFLAGTQQALHAKDVFVPYKEAMKRTNSPVSSESIPFEEVYERLAKKEKFILLDARPQSEYVKQRIEGAKLPLSDAYYLAEKLFKEKIAREMPDYLTSLKKDTAGYARDEWLITYCNRNCSLSKTLAKDLKSLGFKRVHWIEGGIDSWREKGYPLESGEYKGL